MSTRPRALLSVSDKSGIEELGQALLDRGFQLLSTGGTARALREADLPVTEVSDITGHPEIMDGRVKTLHPAIHGPLLARRDVPGDLEALADHGYRPIDVVVVNLYPFRETVARGEVSVEEAMEQVDIGGPTMIRAAAKNHAHLWVVVDPADYPRVVEGLGRPMDETVELRRELAAKVFRHIAGYDQAVADFLATEGGGAESVAVEGRAADAQGAGAPEEGEPSPLPGQLHRSWERRRVLRYGENPDQAAAFYEPTAGTPRGLAALDQLHGKDLSYNNLLDLDGALLSLAPFALSPHPAVCIVKHTTPCGLAVGESVVDAYRKALASDPVSAFGSIIIVNRVVDEEAAEAMSQLFIECVAAPAFTEEALAILTQKKNLRILTFPQARGGAEPEYLPSDALEAFQEGIRGTSAEEGALQALHFLAAHGRLPDPVLLRGVYGGVLAQTPAPLPFYGVEHPSWKVVTQRAPTSQERDDLAFAWAAVYGVKSNAILLAREGATIGIGAGQMSRVDSSRLAVQKAQDAELEVQGSALASDAFFPFRDGVDAAAASGVRCIIQPGGSVRDEEVIQAADEHGLAMIFTGRRLFRH